MSIYKSIIFYFFSVLAVSCVGQDLPIPGFESLPAVENSGPGIALLKGMQVFSMPAGAKVTGIAIPQISQYTTTALPGESVIITGKNFTNSLAKDSAKDAGFLMAYAKANGKNELKWLPVKSLKNDKAIVGIPADIPVGAYIFWPHNDKGYGKPIIINAPKIWWVGPQSTNPGEIISLYGKDLVNGMPGSLSTRIFARKKGSSNNGTWLRIVSSNKYKVDVAIPSGLEVGEYECWSHNGFLGNYGWSNLKTFLVGKKVVWTNNVLNVKDAAFKAAGDGVTDDWMAINNCIRKAATIPNATIFFPAGTYKVSKGFNLFSNVKWLGEAPGKVKIILDARFTYNPAESTQYTLIFSNESNLRCENVTFQNLDFGVQKGAKGGMDALIYMRGSKNIRFDHCSLTGTGGFSKMDLAFSQQVYFKNCQLTLAGLFFARGKQIFIDSTLYNGILDCNVMLEFWGSDGVSVTNCTAKDLDNSDAGQSSGRFLYGNNVWGSNLNMYASNNTTIRMAPRKSDQVSQNAGEQYLWEGANIAYKGTAVSSSPNTMVLTAQSFLQPQAIADNDYGIFVVNGRGVGQFRIVKSVNQSTITLSEPWVVVPDVSSTVLITSFSGNCVLYKNKIQGKAERVNDNIALTGIQLYSNCTNFIVDGNNISDVITGISTWSHVGGIKAGMLNNDFCYFNEFVNNKCDNVRVGASIRAANWFNEPNDGNQLYLGNIFRKNQFKNCIETGISMDFQNRSQENIELSVFENNNTISSKQKLKITSPGSVTDQNLNEQRALRKIMIINNN